MTPLLCVLIPRPGFASRSMRHTVAPDSEFFSAQASPTTPPPMTATSISFMCGDTLLFERMSAQKVPLLDLAAQFAPLRADVLEAIVRVCDAQRFILGPEVEALERELEA